MIELSPELDLYTFLLLIGVVQGIFITYFFFINKNRSITNVNLGCLTLVLTLSLIEIFLNYSGYLLKLLPLHNFSEPLQFLIGPLFYFYIRSYCRKEMNLYQWLHLIPFLFYMGYMVIEYNMPESQKYNSYVDVFHPSAKLIPIENYYDPDPWSIKSFITTKGILIHLFVYLILSVFLLKDEIRSRFSNAFRKNRTKEQSRWISQFLLIALTGILLLPVSKYFFEVVEGETIMGIYITFFIYLLGYSIIRRSAFFGDKKNEKYHTSTLSPEWMNAKLKQLNSLMEDKKPFLDNSFSRSDLARQLAISGHQLSQLINEKTETNFFGLLNKYRTTEAKHILDDPQFDHLNIEQIAYDVGYNSKSAFYTAFKKEFGLTPHAYRKSKS